MGRSSIRSGLPRGAYQKPLIDVVAPYRKGLAWNNLKVNCCPKCYKDWAFDLRVEDHVLVHGCGFAIRESRYSQIVNSQITADLEARWNNEYAEQS